MKLAKIADDLAAMVEYMSRIRPILGVFKEADPHVPAGAIKVLARIDAIASTVYDASEGFPLYTAGVVVGAELADIFDPMSERKNRWAAFDAQKRNVEKLLEAVRALLSESIDRTIRGSVSPSAVAPGGRSS